MKEIAVCALSLLLFSSPSLLQRKTVETYEITIKDNQVHNEIQYQVFINSEGTIPYIDQTHQPYIFKTNEEGKSSLDLEKGNYYIKMVKPTAGYYYDDKIYVLEKEMTLTLDPILYSSTCEERECKVQWSKDDEIIEETNLIAGETYIVQEKDVQDYVYGMPQEVEIPLTKPENPIVIELEEGNYSQLDYVIQTEDEMASECTASFYLDENCTIPATDIFGKEITMQTSLGNEFEIQLLPQIYYIKMEDVETRYAQPTIQKITVNPQQTQELNTKLNLLKLQVHFIDQLTQKEIPVQAKCNNQDELGNEFLVERKQKVQISLGNLVSNYYNIKPVEIEVDKEQQDNIQIEIPLFPFEIQVEGYDINTHHEIPFTYEIVDENGMTKKQIYAGDTVYVQETSCEDGYEQCTKSALKIEEYETTSKTYLVSLEHRGYVHVSIQSDIGSVVALFTNEACTDIAYDRFQNQAIKKVGAYGKATFEMLDGKYYARVQDTNAGYWRNQSIVAMDCKREICREREVNLFNSPIVIHINNENENLENVKYQVFCEGKLLCTTSGIVSGLLLPNQMIEICPINVNGQYLYERKKELQIPATNQEIQVSFQFQPYTLLQLSTNTKERISTTIYEDESCNKIAKDIDGKECIYDLSSKPIDIQLLSGNYWVTTQLTKQYYETKQSIQLDEQIDKKQLEIELKGIEVYVENQDVNTNVTMELLDDQGNLIKTWVNTGTTKIDSDCLEIGQSYMLKDRDGKQETYFELKKDETNPEKIIKVVSKEEHETTKPYWIVIAGLISFLAVLLGIIVLKKNNEISYKE